MLPLLARAAAAAAALLRSPAIRQKAVATARKAASVFEDASRSAVQGCKRWARNREIRVAYNARKRILAADLDGMRQAGASREQPARRAYEFRRGERLHARQRMRDNGDHESVALLEARDAKKYGVRGLGDKDGPNFDGLQRDATTKLREQLGRDPTRSEVLDHIVDSATRTDRATNVKFLTW